MSAIISLDYGSKNVGVAVADGDIKLARPQPALLNDHTLLAKLQELAHAQNADRVLIGLPRNLDGEDTEQTRLVRHFAQTVEKALGIAVILVDEALTTEVAKERLGPKPLRRGAVDSEAAAIILQEYLEALNHAD